MFAVEGQDKNSSVSNNRARTPMFRKIRAKFQGVQNEGQNCNVWLNKIITPMLIEIGSELHVWRII